MAGKRGHGEGTITQLPSGAWRAQVMLGYRPDGKPDRRSITGKTRQDVQRELAKLRRRQDEGTLGDAQAERQTVAAFLSRWLEAMAPPTVRASTHRRYGQIVRLQLVPHLGAKKLSALRPPDIQACYRALLAKGQAPSTVRKIHNTLHRALRDAVRWGELPRNLCDAVDAPALPHREITPPEPADVARLIATAQQRNDALAPLWALAAYTGARQGELLGLQWTDIDVDGATLTIRRTLLSSSGLVPMFGEPKTAKSRRSIRLGPQTVQLMREQRRCQLAGRLRLGADYVDYGLVFASRLGTPLGKRNVIRSFKLALAHAGLSESIRFHDLRHFAATTMRRNGADLKTISERLGHASIRITGDLYTHAAPELDADAALRLERAVGI